MTAFLVLAALMAGACSTYREERTEDGRIVIQYWEKWTAFEKDAMQAVVDKFNASQDRVEVRYLSISRIDQKLLLATAGGNPPDVAGLWENNLRAYAEKGALIPLDSYMKRDGISREDYLPAYFRLCHYHGYTWGLPTTPATWALHYNKRHFREAGLDPEQPPRTIAELDAMAKKLTKYDENGKITQLGFSPRQPDWFNGAFNPWFGGYEWNGTDEITINSPENVTNYQWMKSYPETYGLDEIQTFRSGGSNLTAGQDMFTAEKVSMQVLGVWMYNFVDKYNPDMEWSACPMPPVSEDMGLVTRVGLDVIVIPKGSPHPDEAWEFIKFVQQRENMELLCNGQRKFTPLVDVSEDFNANHDNPFIGMYRKLAESPQAASMPPDMPVRNEFNDELSASVDEMWLQKVEVQEALDRVKQRIQPKLDKKLEQWERVRESRLEEWSKL